jgi:hypothetical protein
MVVYISFAKTASSKLVEQAAKTILNLPIQTKGAWNDGVSTTQSMYQLLQEHHHSNTESMKRHHNGNTTTTPSSSSSFSLSPISIVVVPQANVIAKIKKNGKSIQYHDQIDKERGKELYNLFVLHLTSLLMDHQEFCATAAAAAGGNTASSNNNKPSATTTTTTPDPSIAPTALFKSGVLNNNGDDEGRSYGSYDETTGFPLTTASGEPLTKSSKKKLSKIYDAHVKRHEKWKKQQQHSSEDKSSQPSSSGGSATTIIEKPPKEKSLDPSFIQLVAGTFGKRQGLELYSDMGPFCHVIEI